MNEIAAAKKERPAPVPVATLEIEDQVPDTDLRSLTDGIAALGRLGSDLDRWEAELEAGDREG